MNHGFYKTGNPSVKRHVGDLKPLMSDAMGIAEYMWEDPLATINGSANDVVGRAMTVHALRDDFGRGKKDLKEGSLKGGNAGDRLACCNIVDTTKAHWDSLDFDDYVDSP